jgi:hypothetical protein
LKELHVTFQKLSQVRGIRKKEDAENEEVLTGIEGALRTVVDLFSFSF